MNDCLYGTRNPYSSRIANLSINVMVSIAKGMETRNGNALCSITGVIARKQNDSEFLRCDYFNLSYNNGMLPSILCCL